ncbi:MAG: site-2 protease family protein [Actinomycetota bacterium]|nr:site-2 protease family protein [Acidimicrobiia bacterium]MDQ3470715.1 site-2 protease family protein [Actinomycetota bacterium]
MTTKFDRFRGEVMAGGSVTERPVPAPGQEGDGDVPEASVPGRIAGLAFLGLFGWLAAVNGWMFLFVIGVLVSVFLHEAGHYLTARLTGMKATQFFIGFGPRLWSFQRGETEFGVRLLPLGAFVRIIGMNNIDEVPPEDEERTYRRKTFPRRLLVISAGSLMHLVLAIVLFFAVFAARGELVAGVGAEVGVVVENGPADVAGIRSGDVIVAVDGVAVEEATELGPLVRSYEPGDDVAIELIRDGAPLTIETGLGANTTVPADDELFGSALLGVSSGGVAEWQEMSLGAAATSSVTELFPSTWESVKGVVKVLNPVNVLDHLTGRTDDLATRPTTLVGVTQVSGALGNAEGVIGVLYLLAALNVFVAVFNMFPLLPLDGGHAAVAAYERIREGRSGRRYFADVNKLMPFAMGVIVVLLVLFMSGLYLDLTDSLG